MKTQELKKLTVILFVALLSNFCTSKKSGEEDLELKRIKRIEKSVTDEIESNAEKISLIAVIFKQDEDTIKNILAPFIKNDYLNSEKQRSFKQIIDSISTKTLTPKSMIARLVFAFKYEAITKDEIVNKYIEEYSQ
ncbi:hypothetical protein [Phnomibacter ginsenosidimutans]|uniref:Uncharacterized protein n=1 Tax=Phnomibacter ginsenosidimutans TaxID=2676868 RepID=A0A6I6GGM3_9BACT|nr:hypothetical protein [Phnomibacter ginsenosidimutans]QGW29540.1 hypothetical protein GLV81_16750 [Phnomibacter ginsenosidimutans]